LLTFGAKVVISSRKVDSLNKCAEELVELTGNQSVFPIACNIGDEKQINKLLEKAYEKIGSIDVLVGNAGVNPYYGSMETIPSDAFNKTMTTNVYSNLILARSVSSEMKKKGSGSIIFTSSIGAFKPSLNLGTYNMSKLSLLGLTRNLAAELGPFGIRVNSICPGLIKTDFAKAIWDSPEGEKRAKSDIPLGRLGDSEDFKGIIVYLASDASSYMTGQALTICGGSNMWV
jgi:NAD(P)-dependent dehydrogenase (short-subunit alcohol dehydrogenase family)